MSDIWYNLNLLLNNVINHFIFGLSVSCYDIGSFTKKQISNLEMEWMEGKLYSHHYHIIVAGTRCVVEGWSESLFNDSISTLYQQ